MDLADLPNHATALDGLRREVERLACWRWLELSCSLAAGRGDELSDIDAGVGYGGDDADPVADGHALVAAVGPTVDVLVHAQDGWPEGIVRFAVEYRTGIQLDLVVMPSDQRPGLPQSSVALVDKDGQLAEPWVPPVATTTAVQAREWAMLAWWSLSDVAKYVRRGAWFEAVESLATARAHALRLVAVAAAVAYPAFGLTSLFDEDPPVVPAELAQTYATPGRGGDIVAAALVLADLLDRASVDAGRALAADVTTPWAELARQRLAAAQRSG